MDALVVNDTTEEGWITEDFDDDWDYGPEGPNPEPAPPTPYEEFIRQTLILREIAQNVINGTV